MEVMVEKKTANVGQGSNEKTQPIPWTKHTTDALVSAGSLWPKDNSCAN
jgi:hypothetical protein